MLFGVVLEEDIIALNDISLRYTLYEASSIDDTGGIYILMFKSSNISLIHMTHTQELLVLLE